MFKRFKGRLPDCHQIRKGEEEEERERGRGGGGRGCVLKPCLRHPTSEASEPIASLFFSFLSWTCFLLMIANEIFK